MKTLLISILALVSFQLKAQTWVPVPDTNFQTYLTAHYPVGAFMTSGSDFFIDSDHPDIQAVTNLDVSLQNLSSIEGVQAFVNLTGLVCRENHLTNLPSLPPLLISLNCRNNLLTNLPNLSPNLEVLLCSYNELTVLPNLPSSLELLECTSNQLTLLPNLLPDALVTLQCELNQLTELPEIPPSLLYLGCGQNQLTQLPDFSNSNVSHISCYYNQLTSLSILPSSLIELNCFENDLTILPDLPNGLKILNCSYNELTILPDLPDSILNLNCDFNALTELPELPDSLSALFCMFNQLTQLPELPVELQMLNCVGNQISCFKSFSANLLQISIEQNTFTCLPNHWNTMSLEVLAFPLCDEDDLINNPHGCQEGSGVQGTMFQDVNSNCINSGGTLSYIPILVHDSIGNLLISANGLLNGSYHLSVGPGNYELSVDTANLTPVLQVSCPVGNSSNALIPYADTIVYGGDFGLNCIGFDLGVQSIITNGWVFPGQMHDLSVLAGDLTEQYNMHCASGISGQVNITVYGPGSATFSGSPVTISGNSATYNVADFGDLNANEFLAYVLTDTTALTGDRFCVSVSVTTLAAGELDATNNTYMYCYDVINSYDPNIKETYPKIVEPGFTDEFTYTIHFQNTGSAPAFNIRLADTLDGNLDLSTLKIVNASHPFTTRVNPQSGLLVIRFPNIMLPDSTSNPGGSIGFIQYRVKPLAGLVDGTIIENTASIYFDFNSPIITNTSENLFSETAGLIELAEEAIQLYPNPAGEQVFVKSDNSIEQVMLYDLNGLLVKTISPNSKYTSLDLSQVKSGIYIATVQTNQSIVTKRLIVR